MCVYLYFEHILLRGIGQPAQWEHLSECRHPCNPHRMCPYPLYSNPACLLLQGNVEGFERKFPIRHLG